MTTSETNQAPAAKTAKPETIADDLAQRSIFASPEDATPFLERISAYPDFDEPAQAFIGFTDEGDFDPQAYTPETEVIVAKLNRKGAGVKALVVAPIPTLEAIMADEAGREWARNILRKELNHVLVRPLREAENVTAVLSEVPTTLEAFITSGRDSTGSALESFDALHKELNEYFKNKFPVWAKAKLNKSELRKAFESAGYAAEYYPGLESRASGSFFVAALSVAVKFAKHKGFDSAIFERWLATRDQATFDANADEGLDDIDSLLGGITATPETEGEAAEDDTPAEA